MTTGHVEKLFYLVTTIIRVYAGMFAPRSASRVQTVMTWLQQCIMERRREGGLQVPAPLLTRMYLSLIHI